MIFSREFLLVLGLIPGEFSQLSSQERKKAVKKGYHKKAKEFHPDKWDETSELTYAEQTKAFKDVVHAYKMLSSASYRDTQSDKKSQVSLHAVLSIDLSFTQAFFGMSTTITFHPTHVDSDGKVVEQVEEGEVTFNVDVVKVVIPNNTCPGGRVVFKNRGMVQGDRRGDLIFVINVSPYPGIDYDYETKTFSYIEDVTLETFLKGGAVEVETMFGLENVRIPAGTMPNSIVEKSGIGDDKAYTIRVQLGVSYPNKEELQSNDFWDKLDIDWQKEEDLDDEVRKTEDEYDEIYKRLTQGEP